MHNPNDLTGWTIVFDLDGTLIETAPDLAGALTTLLAEEGLAAPPYEKLRTLIGRGGRWMTQQALALAGHAPTDAELDRLFERMLVLYLARIADESRPFPGAVEAMDALTARGAILAVCTNKRTALSIPLFDALGLTSRFAAIIGADLAPAPKPDPRHLLMTISEAGGDPARSILVGDTESDTLAARAAGIPCIVTDFGYSQVPAIELGGHAVISHFDQLTTVITDLAACAAPTGSL